jgi:hypothetical protein
VSVLDTIRAATPTRKAVTMCLDGALQAEWDSALAALDEAGEQDINTRPSKARVRPSPRPSTTSTPSATGSKRPR